MHNACLSSKRNFFSNDYHTLSNLHLVLPSQPTSVLRHNLVNLFQDDTPVHAHRSYRVFPESVSGRYGVIIG